MRPDPLRLVHVYPGLLGTYGDAGNVKVLAMRARAHGFDVDVVEVEPDGEVPSTGDIYVIGGGEDSNQIAAVRSLRRSNGLAEAVDGGAVVLGVCAGFQILGEYFTTSGGQRTEGLGILDARSGVLAARAVGDAKVRVTALDLPELIGFENHRGATTLGGDAQALGAVEIGIGNGDGLGTEGAVQGRVIATYLHGPVLALNPELADHLLGMVVGDVGALDDTLADNVRAHRLRHALTMKRPPQSG